MIHCLSRLAVATYFILYTDLSLAAPQSDDVFQSILDQYDSSLSSTTGPTSPKSKEPVLGNTDCSCIVYYQCKDFDAVDTSSSANSSKTSPATSNSTFNPNIYGTGVIDIKFYDKIEAGEPQQCSSYLEYCCKSNQVQSREQASENRPKENFESCGQYNPNGIFKVTGVVNEAKYGEFPWMVALMQRGNGSTPTMECGGSIIHPRVILTAAHCVYKKTNLYIRAGEWDTQTTLEQYPIQEVDVKDVITHKDFYGGAALNDVALLVLESPLTLTEVVRTVCLPEQGESMDGRTCLVSGWGKDVFGKEGKYQVILKRIEQPIVSRSPCQSRLRKTRLGDQFQLHESFICAGGQQGKADSCQGDGGGPLVCPGRVDPKQYVQGGIVSWGIGCGTSAPSAYADVARFRNWIDGQMDTLKLMKNYAAKSK